MARPIFPAATALVAMSMNSGPSRLLGIAKQIGFVPSRASRPPNGTTPFADLPESAVIMPINPAFAAMIGYAATRPTCPCRYTVAAATPLAAAFSMIDSMTIFDT